MTRHRFVLSRLIVGVAAIVCTAVHAASVAPVGGEHGMVVTAHQLATKVGVDVLKRGGNAVDAAVAVGYALAVVYPAAGNLGGGGFMTIQLADGRKTFLDFRETAPSRSRPAKSWCSMSSPKRCARSARRAPTASTRGLLVLPSWPRARPARA